jgi:hypothetical protein
MKEDDSLGKDGVLFWIRSEGWGARIAVVTGIVGREG